MMALLCKFLHKNMDLLWNMVFWYRLKPFLKTLRYKKHSKLYKISFLKNKIVGFCILTHWLGKPPEEIIENEQGFVGLR